jgi:ubiquinone/menaquinone biosynthesis C-methylase UbiE
LTDVWGRIYSDYWDGRVLPHVIERDDGRVETFASAAHYFEVPRGDGESACLRSLREPVLDLAAGPGSYSLYLLSRGLEVTTADYSPGALELCRTRGCTNVVRMDLRALDLAPDSFRSVIVMGNTLGLHQTPETIPALLTSLRAAVGPHGQLLFSMIDPLDTDDAAHLRYHERNRERGLPPGLTRIRLKYDDLTDDWASLWMLTQGELDAVMRDTGWRMVADRPYGRFRVRMLEAEG